MSRQATKAWKLAALCGCLLLCLGVSAFAQGPGGGGHPPGGGGMPGGHMPGFPGGSGGPGGFPPHNNPGNMPSVTPTPPRSPSITTSNGIKLGPPGRWWDDKEFIRAIGLRKDQQKKMDAIFNENKPSIIETYKAFEAEQAKLDAISKDTPVDKARMFAAIDAVNQARAALAKANTQMLLQIRDELDATQVAKLEKLP